MIDNGNKVKVLISGDVNGLKTAKEFSKIYEKIFNVVFEEKINDFNLAHEKAEKDGMTHMLHFLDEVNVLLSSFNGEFDYTLEITIDDLKKVLSQNAKDNN